MKISSLSALAFALGGAATSLQARDSGATNILNSLLENLKELDAQVVAYKGGPPPQLRDATSKLFETLKNSAESAKCLDFITPEDIHVIGPLVVQVTEAGGSFLCHLGQTKLAFEAAGICEHLYTYTVHLSKVTNEIFTNIEAKLPNEAKDEAHKGITATNELFNKAEAQLAPGVCINKVEAPFYKAAEFFLSSKDKHGEKPGENHDEPGAAPKPVESSVWYTTSFHNPETTKAPEAEHEKAEHEEASSQPIQQGDASHASDLAGSMVAAVAAVAAAAMAFAL